MSILVDKDTRLIVQGITGRQGSFHACRMKQDGTNIVAGVVPGKAGQDFEGIQIFDTVLEAKLTQGANASIIFVPPKIASASIREAIDAGIEVVVCITDGVPIHEMMDIKQRLKEEKTRLIGPNTPGLITPGETKLGIMAGYIFKKGSIGIVTRSGSLTYEISYELTHAGLGQSTVVGLGGDYIKGTDFIDILPLFEADPDTNLIVMIGEIGGTDEERTAEYIKKNCSKPVIAYIAGKSSPSGQKMGHAGAIISQGKGTFQSKIEAFKNANIPVANYPIEVKDIALDLLKQKQLGAKGE
jgi:succinyl-CoA synthetase alpha subunit